MEIIRLLLTKGLLFIPVGHVCVDLCLCVFVCLQSLPRDRWLGLPLFWRKDAFHIRLYKANFLCVDFGELDFLGNLYLDPKL